MFYLSTNTNFMKRWYLFTIVTQLVDHASKQAQVKVFDQGKCKLVQVDSKGVSCGDLHTTTLNPKDKSHITQALAKLPSKDAHSIIIMV